MAKKPEKVEIPQEEEPRKSSFLWMWIVLAAGCFFLFAALLHVSGALRGVEEAVYGKVKGIPVIGYLASPLHKESWEGRLSPEQVIDVKDLRRELLKTQNAVNSLERLNKKIRNIDSDMKDAAEAIQKLDGKLKNMEESYTPAGGGALTGSGVAAAAPAIGVPTMGMESRGGPQTENFRAVSKIFEKIDAETSVDILSNLTDNEKVEILAPMKESLVAEIFAAMEPTTAAELSKLLARKKAMR